MSKNGLLRPLSASHDVCWAFQPGDYLYVWKAKDRQDARRLEQMAIDLVGPAYNGHSSDRPQRPTTDDEDDDPLVEDHDAPPRPEARNLTLFGDST